MDRHQVQKIWLSALKLSEFRNYTTLSLDLSNRHIVLYGNNGAGKTNILESISFLTPGRGMRRASFVDVANNQGSGAWTVAATLTSDNDTIPIGSGFVFDTNQTKKSRRTRINSATASSADSLLEYIRVIWLTPAMDGLFTGPSADRRRFLDRMVLAIDPQHGRRVVNFEKAMRNRNRLLFERPGEIGWLEGLETQLAEFGVAIAQARQQLVESFTDLFESSSASKFGFPSAGLLLEGEFENLIQNLSTLEAQQLYLKTIVQMRDRDGKAGRLLTGPHLVDLKVKHREKNIEAARASTGEQKALLIGLILAHAKLVWTLSGIPPILLLDEVAAHLDASRRTILFEHLEEHGGQCWLTGTDQTYFEAFEERAQRLHVINGSIAD